MARRVAIVVVLVLAGCAGTGGVSNPLEGHGEGRASGSLNPFAPAEIRVHPLTRFEGAAGEGGASLVLHVEVRDAYRDTVKGAGQLLVTLYESGGPSIRGEDLRWSVDLASPEVNARLYDRSTRTYRCPLGDIPGEVRSAIAGDSGRAFRLRVALDTWGVDGSPIRLLDDRPIDR